jgi:hypothetical protein
MRNYRRKEGRNSYADELKARQRWHEETVTLHSEALRRIEKDDKEPAYRREWATHELGRRLGINVGEDDMGMEDYPR